MAPRGVAIAIRFMQRNLARPLTTGEIAAAAGTSERSLRRQFRRFTGQSPIAFHRHLRLEAARHALCDHAGADITTAASAHGFSHLSHFTAQYRRRYGELPSASVLGPIARAWLWKRSGFHSAYNRCALGMWSGKVPCRGPP